MEGQDLRLYTDALLQLMNTFQALTLPLHSATPERYFRDYAYAAAVFYSNPKYQDEVIQWCNDALCQAELSNNLSGKQWVISMLGSLYRRSGDLNKALELFMQSKYEAESRNDHLGVLNSLNTLTDIFLYWNVPEYADIYANEAVHVEKNLKSKNPMVSAQTYINKGRALLQLGKTDSIGFYTSQARSFCEALPYNSGMVDVNLLNGICLTEKGGDSLASGIEQLQLVARQGTAANRAKAYHQLAQICLKQEGGKKAEVMLDSLSCLLSENISPVFILHLDYKPILDYYKKVGNRSKADQYVQLMLKEQEEYSQKRQDVNLVKAIVGLQAEKRVQDQKIARLKQANQRLWMIFSIVILVIIISGVMAILLRKMKRYKKEIKKADVQLKELIHNLNKSNTEKEMIAWKMNEFLHDKDKRQEMITLTPYVLKESGELKFRECFELLHPHFLHRLREKVPAVTRREELLSMLIVLKQDNRKIAELMAIELRSVLMLRHRFRQKIGMTTEISLENFIENLTQ